MLEGLKQVPWSRLRHAYGRASDTPRHLRALTSRWKFRRDRAIDKLSWSIVHQGSVYEAAAYAVPFLIELATSPLAPERDRILEMLYDIATGGSWHEAHQHMEPVRRTWDEQQIAQHIREQHGWIDQIVRELRNGITAVLPLLNDRDVTIRMQAARLLTAMKAEDSAPIVAAMKSALGVEQDALARANLLRGIGWLSAQHHAPMFRAHFDDKQAAPIVRLSAALELIAATLQDPPADAIDFLVDVLKQRDRALREQFSRMPMGGSLLETLTAFLNVAPEPLRARAATLLLDELDSNDWHISDLGAYLLRLVLPKDRKTFEGIDRAGLSELQRRAIARVARSAWPNEKTLFGNAHDVLLGFDLPRDQQSMRDLLGFDFRASPGITA
jgi:hypothetical protein